jgi:restriction endonuclease
LEAVEAAAHFLEKVAGYKQQGLAGACKKSWDQVGIRLGAKRYCDLVDSSGDDIPSFSIVIPTGGGKTITAMGCAIRALRIKQDPFNILVWIVPSDAIFEQTKEYLNSGYLRDFAASSGFDKVVLKLNGDSWNDFDLVPGVLTVVLLTQQSIFSEKADRIFHRRCDLFEALSHPRFARVASLKELLEATKPIIVVDEAHKTYTKVGRAFFRSNSLAWCLMEFSATPKEYSDRDYPNVLYAVRADRLIEEQLLKNPLRIHLEPNKTVEGILDDVIRLRSQIEAGLVAERYYIKPKVLISCYRTSEDQAGARNSAHAIRDMLMQRGISAGNIAFKTSERDDLGGVSVDSPGCVFEFILTKQALVEGWDAKFM